MEVVTVNAPGGAYEISIGPRLLQRAALFEPLLGPANIIVTDHKVAPLYLDRLRQACAGRIDDVVVLPDGEDSKTLDSVRHIIDVLAANDCHRDAVLIALGGGVIGDMTGFAAAIYQRGVDFIQVPTTLLAQVDAAVGGKTAVNHPRGKNLVGAFHQPRAVISDTTTLSSLDRRHLRAGMAEVIKHGLLADETFFAWLETNMSSLLDQDSTALSHAIRRCCEIKAAIVAMDERERGPRALLNLGHTFAHAIEAQTRYAWLHGEAVGTGLVMAAQLSAATGLIGAAEVARVEALVASAGLETKPPQIALQDWLRWMQMDKKVQQGSMRFVVLEAIGRARVDARVPGSALEQVLNR